jgi:SAM-dependent methyltransferase
VPPGAPVLDLAAGSGRHTRLFVARGHPVTALDRDVNRLADLRAAANLEVVQADLEDGSPWPLPGRRFGAVIVTNYLWRPLFPTLVAAVDAGGSLLYETFGAGNAAHGPPRDPDFLLAPGELLDAVRGELQVVAYEHGFVAHPRPAVRQRICALRSDRPASRDLGSSTSLSADRGSRATGSQPECAGARR